MLTVRGISYLVGEASTDDVRRDLEVIARDLHCTTVMLVGDGKRLIDAARTALETGLGVYIRPNVPELPQPKLLEHLDAIAEAAEELRREHPDRVTLLVGSEFSHTVPGIVPGPRSFLRLKLIMRFRRVLRRRIDRRLHRLLTTAVITARRRFGGPVTYSAAGWEHVDWSLFDLVGVSLYRSGRNHTTYTDRLRSLVRNHDKPVVITEFGCGAFTGADQRGAGSFWIVNWFAAPRASAVTIPAMRPSRPATSVNSSTSTTRRACTAASCSPSPCPTSRITMTLVSTSTRPASGSWR